VKVYESASLLSAVLDLRHWMGRNRRRPVSIRCGWIAPSIPAPTSINSPAGTGSRRIPSSTSRVGGVSTNSASATRRFLREILEQAAKPPPAAAPNERKIAIITLRAWTRRRSRTGHRADPAGTEPIAALKDKSELAAMVARLHASFIPAMFGFSRRRRLQELEGQHREREPGRLEPAGPG